MKISEGAEIDWSKIKEGLEKQAKCEEEERSRDEKEEEVERLREKIWKLEEEKKIQEELEKMKREITWLRRGGTQRRQTGETRTCFKCGKTGHIAINCELNKDRLPYVEFRSIEQSRVGCVDSGRSKKAKVERTELEESDRMSNTTQCVHHLSNATQCDKNHQKHKKAAPKYQNTQVTNIN